MSNLSLERLQYDPADAANSPNVGAYVKGSDGTHITHTGAALDVNITNSLTLNLDGVYSGGNTDPDNVGMILHDRAASPADTDQTFRPTGGTLSADNITAANIQAVDTASFLHAYDGAAWDRLTTSAGALDINIAAQDSDLTVDIATNLVVDDVADTGGSLKAGSVAADGVLTAVSADGDRADLTSDMYRRIYVNDAPNISIDVNAVSVGLAAVNLSATPIAGRTRMMVQNNGLKPIFVGPSGVLAASGLEVAKGGTLSMEIGEDIDLYAISTVAAQDVRVLEFA
jgi:hypothetical protein